jgi:hypothetical protein
MSCAVATQAGRAELGGAGRVGQPGSVGSGGWGWAGGGVPRWTVAVFEPNGLCRFRVKNARWVVSRW